MALNSRIKGATLIEVLVALLIITIVFMASTILFFRITQINPGNKMYWDQRLQEIAHKIKSTRTYENETISEPDGTLIYIYCTPYREDSPLIYLKLEALQHDKRMAIYEEIIYASKNEYSVSIYDR